MKPIKRVYIAGPLTPKGVKDSNPAIEYIYNVRDMVRVGIEVMHAGFSPFIPALDFLVFINLREGEKISEAMIQQYSIDWLLACDAVVLTSLYETSRGTLAEIKCAQDAGIPVFHSVQELIDAVQG